MTTPHAESTAAVSQFFIQEARRLLIEEYLPKIERCFERLTDEQVWWRPNLESNSIGNLLLHLRGNVSQWIIGGVGGQARARRRQQEFDETFHCERGPRFVGVLARLPEDGLLPLRARLRCAVEGARRCAPQAEGYRTSRA